MSPWLGLARGLSGLALVALAAGPAAAEAVSFAVDPLTSHVRIHLGRSGLFKFLGHEHHIEAPLAEGQVEVVDEDPARSSVRLRFEARRLAVIPGSEPEQDIPKVEERMRGPEVLEVSRYPEIAFVSTAVKRRSREGSRLQLLVAGTLELRGRSFPLELPLEVRRDGNQIEARGEIRLNLRDVGIEPPSVAGVVKVSNRFRLELEIRARAEAAQP